jgi:hypothetical protein
VQRYCAKILEEVDEGAALALMQAESDVSAREASLKGMREEVRSIASVPLLLCFVLLYLAAYSWCVLNCMTDEGLTGDERL